MGSVLVIFSFFWTDNDPCAPPFIIFFISIIEKKLNEYYVEFDFRMGGTKVYRLGGETDSAIRWRKRTSCDVGERPEEAGC